MPFRKDYIFDKNLSLEEKGLYASLQVKDITSNDILESYDKIKELCYSLEKKGYLKIDYKTSSDRMFVVYDFNDEKDVLVLLLDRNKR